MDDPLPLFPGSADPLALRPQPARNGLDFWRTPPCLLTALTRFVLPDIGYFERAIFWEPTAGGGHIVRALEPLGRPVVASDLAPQDPGVVRHDFVHDDPLIEGADVILPTNPPFNDLDGFIARGLSLLDRGRIGALVLLMNLDHSGAAGRAAVFNRVTRMWTCTWRPIWVEGTYRQGRWWPIWATWERGRPRQPPRWLTLADLAQTELLLQRARRPGARV